MRHDAHVSSGSDPGCPAGVRARRPHAGTHAGARRRRTRPKRAAPRRDRTGLPHQPRRPVPQGLDLRVAAGPPGPRHGATAEGRRRRPPPGQLGRGPPADRRRGAGRPAPRTGRTPSACSAAAASPTRRPTSWASSPGWRWAPRGSTTTDGSACPRPPRPACAPSAWTAGCRSRWRTSDAASTILMLGSNVAETMPPFVQHLQGARDAGGLIVVDPRRSATAAFTSDGGGLHLQPLPGTDLALLLGISHAVIHEGLADAGYIAARTSGYDAVVRSVGRLLAGAGPVDHRRPRRADPRHRPAAGRRRPQGRQLHPHRPRRRTARRRHGHRHGRHQPLASCWAFRAPRAAATARSPGRATARAAANTARRRTSSPATGRSPTPPPAPTWPGSGAYPKP